LSPDPTGLDTIRAAAVAEFLRLKPGRLTPKLMDWYRAWLADVEREVQAELRILNEDPPKPQ
jgi:hypothetical protein